MSFLCLRDELYGRFKMLKTNARVVRVLWAPHLPSRSPVLLTQPALQHRDWEHRPEADCWGSHSVYTSLLIVQLWAI